jgi:hypothetical protein
MGSENSNMSKIGTPTNGRSEMLLGNADALDAGGTGAWLLGTDGEDGLLGASELGTLLAPILSDDRAALDDARLESPILDAKMDGELGWLLGPALDGADEGAALLTNDATTDDS